MEIILNNSFWILNIISFSILTFLAYYEGEFFGGDEYKATPTYNKIFEATISAVCIIVLMNVLVYMVTKYGVCNMTFPCYVFSNVNVC